MTTYVTIKLTGVLVRLFLRQVVVKNSLTVRYRPNGFKSSATQCRLWW